MGNLAVPKPFTRSCIRQVAKVSCQSRFKRRFVSQLTRAYRLNNCRTMNRAIWASTITRRLV